MRRVMYLYLPNWPIDRLRQMRGKPGGGRPADASPGDAPLAEPPFATVIEMGGRRLLAAVSPAAAEAGLAPGMPLADALSFLPSLLTSVAEPAEDAVALTRLAEWCVRYSPWTAPDRQPGDIALGGSPGGSYGVKIEITGCAHLWGGEEQLVADLARRLARRRIAHRVAVAGTIGAAWALARFAAQDGQPALPAAGDERQALAGLPVEALRLDPATAAGLRRVGLRRIGELYPMPRDALARRFGETVAHRLDQALDAMPEPLSPLGETPARRVRLSFAEPIADPADFARAIERLVGDLAARLAREGTGARRLDLAFHRVDGRVEHIRIGTARPSRDPRHLAALLAAKLETVDPGLGVEDMILALFAAEPLPPEQTRMNPLPPKSPLSSQMLPSQKNPLPPSGGEGRVRGASSMLAVCSPYSNAHWERGSEDWTAIAPLLDRLGARLGLDALSRIEARESHIPERASVNAPVGGYAEAGAVSPKPPRPVRVFAPPEAIEAIWVTPDDPPSRFTWRRRAHRVRHAAGPERIAEEWWTEDGSAMPDAVRDYYRVEDADGRRFWLFRAGLAADPPPRWFIHGLFA